MVCACYVAKRSMSLSFCRARKERTGNQNVASEKGRFLCLLNVQTRRKAKIWGFVGFGVRLERACGSFVRLEPGRRQLPLSVEKDALAQVM
jgi:hypothetical protein